MGERTPHLDPYARGGWIGLTAKHTRADLIRSVIEGVSYSQQDCLSLIDGMGVPVSRVRVSGGGARSELWRRILADVFGRPVATVATQEGSAYGVALLAMVGSGLFGSVREACGALVRETARVEPDPAGAAVYARGYALFREIYPVLKNLFPQM